MRQGRRSAVQPVGTLRKKGKPTKAIAMKAMLFAAGKGTRLLPVTTHTPKALVEVGGKPILLHAIEKLVAAGASELVVNVHHHAGQVIRFVRSLCFPGVTFHVSDESGQLLDTGGGLKKAAHLLRGDAPVILYNADILCDADLGEMVRHHRQASPLATLAVSDRRSSRYFLWDNGKLAGWEHVERDERVLLGGRSRDGLRALAFSGIHVVRPDLPGLITETGAFPITGVYLRLAREHAIICHEHAATGWADIGTPEKLASARRRFANGTSEEGQ